MASERDAADAARGEGDESVDAVPKPEGAEGAPIVGTAIGGSDVGAGVRGGDVGRAGAAGDAAGGTHDSAATGPGDPGGEASGSVDANEFARATAKRGSEAGLAGGQGDLGAGGDVSGDFGGLDEEGDEGRPA